MTSSQDSTERTPRIAIMGEFSAGKSTLCNLLMNMRALPEKVTATRLAPVWMTKGPGEHMRVTTDGTEEPVTIGKLGEIPFEDTLYIRLRLEADILDHCDFIDFPGISDPNMDPDVWARVLVEADAVIWLTHATQAWRQSEAAVWDIVPEEVRKKSILLATRFDKVVSEQDRTRVMQRLNREAGPHFAGVFPISLTNAMAARDDYDKWAASGVVEVMDHLTDLITDLATADAPEASEDGDKTLTPRPAPVSVKTVGPAQPVKDETPETPSGPRVLPRRVTLSGTPRRARPTAISA
ncbi:dynamin family protein [uncultured Tateyamaria sp.]|uniref:dynamin family protein n=1 Tax=uncultured Tateyamaria sp. TaxID=455651 RepID=UPI0026303CB3|nr:dynamin family protein [uncultured Tateyamaria sp.]